MIFRRLAALLVPPLLALAPARADLVLSLDYVDTASPAYARFETWVDQAVAGSPGYGFSATDAVFMYRITAEPQYATLAIGWVEDQVVAAEAAIAAGERPEIAFDSYLYAGPMLRDLALVYAWTNPLLTAGQKTRWEAYADQTLWNIWHPASATWGGNPFPWSGWGTDNPGNNYHFSFLQATIYWALAANRAPWIADLTNVRLPAVVAYYQQMPGGGSREGTGYGVAQQRLFELYRLWRDSTGVDLADDSTHLADTIDYWIHATVPTLDRYAPIGDLARESYPWLYDYHRALVLQARAMAGAAPQSARASWWLHRIAIDAMTSGFNFRDDLLPAGTTEAPPPTLHHHATGTGHLFARSGWTSDALWLSFVAGELSESHAHQEQGAVNLFRDDFLAVSENVFTHSGIEQGPEVHNTLRFVNGSATLEQHPSTSPVTVSANGARLHVVADLSSVHAASGLVSAWTRTLDFDPLGVTIDDQFAVSGGVTAFFQLNTPVAPVLAGGVATAAGLRIVPLEPADPTMTVLDWSTVDPQEFLSGYKLELSGGATRYCVRLELVDGLFADGFESGDTSAWSP